MSLLTFAANNGSIGGGEVMLLRMAEAARELGVHVHIVAPEEPGELASAASAAGFATTTLPGRSRRSYLRRLRAWDRQRTGLLWCNGLVPAVATTGRRDRIVHLHQAPRGPQVVASRLAAWGAARLLVPSTYMTTQVRGAQVFPNWTDGVLVSPGPRMAGSDPVRVGFIGRLSQDKGVDTLAEAIGRLNARTPGSVRLILAGDHRFVPDTQARKVRRQLESIAGDVTELGWVGRDEFFSQVDLAVFPSTWGEPFGLVAAEAMAAGVPFVISDAGALPEVAGRVHPWVSRAGDVDELASVIASAIATDPTATTLASRRRWEAEYSPAAGGCRFAAVLRELGLLTANQEH